MPIYMYQAAYTPESWAAQLKNPQKRLPDADGRPVQPSHSRLCESARHSRDRLFGRTAQARPCRRISRQDDGQPGLVSGPGRSGAGPVVGCQRQTPHRTQEADALCQQGLDCSPKGDKPGFVQVEDDGRTTVGPGAASILPRRASHVRMMRQRWQETKAIPRRVPMKLDCLDRIEIGIEHPMMRPA